MSSQRLLRTAIRSVAASTGILLGTEYSCGKAYALSPEELKFVNKSQFEKSVSEFADIVKPFVHDLENNKELAKCFGSSSSAKEQIYYPVNNGGRLSAESTCAYARVATTVVNASVGDVSDLLFERAPSCRAEWSNKNCLEDTNLRLGNKFDLEEAEQEHRMSAKQAGKITGGRGSEANIHFNYTQLKCSNGLPPRELYSWCFKGPGGTVGLYEHFNTVCILQMDAIQRPNIFTPPSAMHEVIPASANSRQVVRARGNSCFVLEYLAPQKTRVTYILELDPNIYLLYPATVSPKGWISWLGEVLQYMFFLWGSDESLVLETLRALRRQVEAASQEEQGMSVEEAAKARLKKQRTMQEQHALSANLSMSASGFEVVSDEVVSEQEALVTMLGRKLADIRKDEKKNDAGLPSDFYQEMRERIEKDLGRAQEKLTDLKTLREEQSRVPK